MKVVIIEDSIFFQKALDSVFKATSDIDSVNVFSEGVKALEWMQSNPFDLIIVDLEMPGLSGEEVIEKIREFNKKVPIIIFSSEGQRSAKRVIEAFKVGASDFVTKGESNSVVGGLNRIKEVLLPKVLQFKNSEQFGIKENECIEIDLNEIDFLNREALLIGISTGGPETLRYIFSNLEKEGSYPIFIVQHMPATFTNALAKSLNRITSWEVKEARDDEEVIGGVVYIAPGDKHMHIYAKKDKQFIRLSSEEKINFLRPSVDVTLKSVSEIYKDKLVTLIMTGMGRDGTDAAILAKENGSLVLAQNKESSVIWGMPKEIVEKKIASGTLSTHQIIDLITFINTKNANKNIKTA